MQCEAPGCTRETKYTPYCKQHLASIKGLKIAKSRIPHAGKGLWATRDFEKDEHIDEYTGILLTDEQVENEDSLYIFSPVKGVNIDSADPNSNAARFADDIRWKNRRDYPELKLGTNNAKFVWDSRNKKLNLVADRKIYAGQEICAPYGKNYWRWVDKKQYAIKTTALRSYGAPQPKAIGYAYKSATMPKARKTITRNLARKTTRNLS